MKLDSMSHRGLSIYSIRIFLIDILALTFVYLVPTISHLTKLPLYFFEPMRIAVFVCLIHTTTKNTFLIAATIPLFSLIVSSHPEILKSVLITMELLANLLLLFIFTRKGYKFSAMFISIVLSKSFYYLTKSALLQLNLIEGSLISTPVVIQWIMAIGLSFYVTLKYEEFVN